MTIDVIICTYNRQEKVIDLVDEILFLKKDFVRLIVVDSSNIENNVLKYNSKVTYLKSSHKNQPYQRYLGYIKSSAEILLYLDDDMEVLDSSIFQDVIDIFTNLKVVGIGLAFLDKHKDTFLNMVTESFLTSRPLYLKKLRQFSGYSDLKKGEFGWNGLRGMQPFELAPTKWFSGGAFAVRKKDLFQNFNFQLFDLFEKRIGMGEDLLISYTLSKRGKLLFYPKVKFFHNDQKDSSYTPDFYSYSFRVMYSRLFLSLEYARLNNYSSYTAIAKFNWYAIWRILGLLINFSLNPSVERKIILKGSFKGWIKAFSLNISNFETRNKFWINEVQLNLSNSFL